MKKSLLGLFAILVVGVGWAVVGADGAVAPKKIGSATVVPTKPAAVIETAPAAVAPSAPVVAPEAVPTTVTTSESIPAAAATTTAVAVPGPPVVHLDPLSINRDHLHLSLGALTPTPEMWFYEQQRLDYMDPAMQVRRRGEQAAAERRARLAARAWYGLSASRPTIQAARFARPVWHANTVGLWGLGW